MSAYPELQSLRKPSQRGVWLKDGSDIRPVNEFRRWENLKREGCIKESMLLEKKIQMMQLQIL